MADKNVEALRELAGANNWASKKAQMALDLTQQRVEGSITKSEYEELVDDLIRTDEVAQRAQNVEIASKLKWAVQGLLKIL